MEVHLGLGGCVINDWIRDTCEVPNDRLVRRERELEV